MVGGYDEADATEQIAVPTDITIPTTSSALGSLDTLPMDLTENDVHDPFGVGWLFNAIGDPGTERPGGSHGVDSASSPLPPFPAFEGNDATGGLQAVASGGPLTPDASGTSLPAKIGTRFSREAVRILRQWLDSNREHPYPNDDERHILQQQTGLSKTQIANWLANARRRTMVQQNRPTSTGQPETETRPINIPRRSGTPTPESRRWQLNPLERWYGSPPEDEPADATAIARAIASRQSRMWTPCFIIGFKLIMLTQC